MKPDLKDMATQTNSANKSHNLEELKRLLVSSERKAIRDIYQRLNAIKGVTAEEVAEVLSKSIEISTTKGNEVSKALDAPLNESIKQAARKHPDIFADALYPVITPAIRKSITETLKEFITNINRTLDNSFSAQGMKWRLEAYRTGVPFSEIVLRNTLAYRVEQVMLIEPESGLLIHNIANEEAQRDPDAVSAMLTAIGDFARDAFVSGKSQQQSLETIEMGEHTVQITHGPRAYLAVVVMGIPPDSLRKHCREVLVNIHRSVSVELSGLPSDSSEMRLITPMLESCIQSEIKDEAKKSGLSTPFIVLVSIIALIFAWSSYKGVEGHQEISELHQRFDQLVNTLENDPGIAITRTTKNGKELSIFGLADPIAKSPTAYIEEAGFSTEQISLHFRPFYTFSPELVIKRATEWLNPPKTIEFSLNDKGVLSLRGEASTEWIDGVRKLTVYIPGINQIDTSGIKSNDDAILKEFVATYTPPSTVQVKVKEGKITLSGEAEKEWINTIDDRKQNIKGLVAIEHQNVSSAEENLYNNLFTQIEQTKLFFNEEIDLTQESTLDVEKLINRLNAFIEVSKRLNKPVMLTIIGYSDGTGDIETNNYLANARAFTINELLVARGLPEVIFRLKSKPSPLAFQETQTPSLRMVEFKILKL